MFERILVVCVGNICRSPTVEYLLRHRLGDRKITVSSAGLGALEGHPIDPTAGELLAEHGIDASAHRARQLEDRHIIDADLILVMQRAHLATLAKRSPHAVGRSFLLGKWQDDREVPDPFRQQRPAFEHVYRLIDEGVDGWLRRL
ncbi:low molecular weight protein-tyrosine-phosphatase [Frateuria sp. STR12]|uniref:low molecular weight protein-tyrosine-phosphatase n=1 Tax=Frateuria hangzhouensis TaxID=2995589 RepID=UPI002260D3C1|nr:low molecular weight protein-tyrosine-phosphatase [Frateuria sp. STR12]MCX7515281.1 low molecular weight phosphotyrosine protein phosphatase [Frateuria sp. STR12]